MNLNIVIGVHYQHLRWKAAMEIYQELYGFMMYFDLLHKEQHQTCIRGDVVVAVTE